MARLPPVRAIQAFEAIARLGSVAAAADELGVSSGAISQQLRKIETELDAKLFKRAGRSLTLTSWGRLYYEQVRSAFDDLRRAQQRLQAARERKGIAISSPPSLCLWLQPSIMAWNHNQPTVELRIIARASEPVLHEEGIDFRLCYGADARRYDRFSELFRDSVVPVCSPEFLRQHPVESAADILASPRIDIVWDTRHRAAPSWVDWAWTAGIAPPRHASRLSFSLSSAAIEAACRGGGFILGQLSLVTALVNEGRLVIPIDQRLILPDPYFLAWERDTLDRPICAEFRNALLAAGLAQQNISAGIRPLSDSAHRPTPAP